MQSDVQNLQEIREELQKYASGDMIPSLDEVFRECNAVVTRSILVAFSLPIFDDKDGGNVTTIHNFTQGITASDADKAKFLEFDKNGMWTKTGHRYVYKDDRKKYAPRQKAERDAVIKSNVSIDSGYTNSKNLPHDGRTELEHIVPIGEIEEDPRNFLFLTQKGRIDLAYNEKNLTWLEKSINSSKDDYPLKTWLNMKQGGRSITNAEYFGINVEKAIRLDDTARKAYKAYQRKAAIKKQGIELAQVGLKQGAILGTREVLAIVFIEFNDEASICIQGLMERYRHGDLTMEEIIEEGKTALFNIKDRLLEKYKEIISTFFTGVGSGILSNLLVFAINNFITTARHIVSIIREAVYALIHTGKIMCSDAYPTSEAKAQAAADVLISSITICLTVLLGDAMQKYLSAVPYNEEISQALSAIIAGVSIILISYYFQSMQAELAATTAAVTKTALTTMDVIEIAQQLEQKSENRSQKMKSQTQKLSSLKF